MPDYRSTDLAGAAYLAQGEADKGAGQPGWYECDDFGDAVQCPYTGERCRSGVCCDDGCQIELDEELAP